MLAWSRASLEAPPPRTAASPAGGEGVTGHLETKVSTPRGLRKEASSPQEQNQRSEPPRQPPPLLRRKFKFGAP